MRRASSSGKFRTGHVSTLRSFVGTLFGRQTNCKPVIALRLEWLEKSGRLPGRLETVPEKDGDQEMGKSSSRTRLTKKKRGKKKERKKKILTVFFYRVS